MPEDKLSAIDLFDDLQAESFPLFLPRMSLLWVLEREANEPGQFEGQVTISLENQQLAKVPFSANFDQQTLIRQIVSIGGLVVQQPGRVRVVFSSANIADAVYEFKFTVAPQVQQANPPAPAAPAIP